jgi:hypothetical protein
LSQIAGVKTRGSLENSGGIAHKGTVLYCVANGVCSEDAPGERMNVEQVVNPRH